ncbi:MAG: ABC transporter substrate-binding protein [Proteobacteria bacterium]|nr:ABC transporter substrate-binding protein [Pseudomonadota bacterium]
MRVVLAATVSLATLFAVLPTSAQTPKAGGTLVYAVNAEPPNYDCTASTSYVMQQTLGLHYSQLLKFDPDNYPNFKPDIAESYAIAPDQLTVTFKLRPGVKFHDGTVLTSEDVKATFERLRKPPANVVSVRQASFEDIDRIETPDANTVVFRMTKPNAAIMNTFAAPTYCIYSARRIAADPEWPKRNIMGTGPYLFREHVAGSHWIAAKNPDYFVPNRPYLDGVRIQFITGAPMINALQGGQIMAEFRGITPADRERLKAALGDRILIEEVPWICRIDLFFNTTKAPYNDVRVRRALSMAIDRQGGAPNLARVTFVRDVGGVMRPGDELAMTPQEVEKIPGFGRDIAARRAEARKLLADAGIKDLKFSLLNRTVPQPFGPVALFVIDQWRQIGVTVEHAPRELAQQKAAILSGNFEAGIDANCYDTDEPNNELLMYLSKDRSPINQSQHSDAKIDELYELQKRARSKAERIGYLRQLEARLYEQAYNVPLIWWHRIVARSPAIKGWKLLPTHYVNQDLADVWLDQ